MLNQRMPLPKCCPAPVPSVSELTAALAVVSAFLDGFEGLPAPSVTVHADAVGIQFAHMPAGEMFPAVARLARLLGSEARLRPVSDSWHFQARGQLRGLEVSVFAAVDMATDPVRAGGAVA
ncbi:hypothetical protein ACFP1Z_06710 [Streptomyces gamaensis]|uniref:Uncharacterized protein n=1 Tax=Streptomyces gamaensis TaxID=1763542 RepID=A0ABW0YXB9_9ACTN